MKKTMVLMALLIGSSAFANSAIECGTNVNKEDGTVGEREILVSSEDGHKFKAYGANDKEIVGAKIQIAADGGIVVTLGGGRDIGGTVGTQYKIAPSDGNSFTTATKSTVGGFAGGTSAGSFVCVVSED